MSRNINTKIINTNDLSGKSSVWEVSWQLLHKYKNINGELIFTDSEITDYPIFQFNLANWLINENNNTNGIFDENTKLKVPKDTLDLITIIATLKLKTHDQTSIATLPVLPKISVSKNEDLPPLNTSNRKDKSSDSFINATFLEKFIGFATGTVIGTLILPARIGLPVGGSIGMYNGEKIFALYFGVCQSIIDDADKKVSSGGELNESELDTLILVYKLIPLGGKLYGYKEAATLMSLYLNPKKAEKYTKEKPYIIDSEVYTTSEIVKYAEEELKKIILNDYTEDVLKVGKNYNSKILEPTDRDSVTKGNVQAPDRNLIVEQNNQRLKNTDHRFYLQVKILEIANNNIRLLWYVNSVWDYASYEDANYVTELPIKKGYILKIPDGLSHHLIEVNRAKEFCYTSRWEENICIKN